ncbi:MAG: hypothetical protein WA667_22795 [Candidatus Nitrosopolaris sp.]
MTDGTKRAPLKLGAEYTIKMERRGRSKRLLNCSLKSINTNHHEVHGSQITYFLMESW